MTDTITLTGLVATAPRHITTGEGLPITSFRLASSQRRYDRTTNTWLDGDTNWYTVTTFRRLATSTATSVTKGDRVLVTGRLRIRDWSSADRQGTTMEVDAEALGPDLSWGTATFTRTLSSQAAAAAAADSAMGTPPDPGNGSDEVPSDPAGDDAFPPADDRESLLVPAGAAEREAGDDDVPF